MEQLTIDPLVEIRLGINKALSLHHIIYHSLHISHKRSSRKVKIHPISSTVWWTGVRGQHGRSDWSSAKDALSGTCTALRYHYCIGLLL